MKKTLFLIIFSAICLFTMPQSGRAVTYEVSVGVSNVYIPERAGAILASAWTTYFQGRATEFWFDDAYLSIRDEEGNLVPTINHSTRAIQNRASFDGGSLYAGVVPVVFSFSSDGSHDYNLFAEVKVLP